VTRGKGIRPFGEHVDDLIPVHFAEITSLGTHSRAINRAESAFGATVFRITRLN
jgi:hypothetical protein